MAHIVDLEPYLVQAQTPVRQLLALSIGVPTEEKIQRVCDAYFQNPAWKMLGCEEEGSIQGCIGLELLGGGQAEVHHLAVSENYRRKGIGRTLLEAIVGRFALQHLVLETHSEAVPFYENCGFVVTSLGEKYPGIERFSCSWSTPIGSNP